MRTVSSSGSKGIEVPSGKVRVELKALTRTERAVAQVLYIAGIGALGIKAMSLARKERGAGT